MIGETDWNVRGYLDGREGQWCPPNAPDDLARYRHSFEVGAAEAAGRPIPAGVSRWRAAEIERKIQEADPCS